MKIDFFFYSQLKKGKGVQRERRERILGLVQAVDGIEFRGDSKPRGCCLWEEH